MPGVPTQEECRRLFEEFDLDPLVVEHVEAVARLGTKVAQALRTRGRVVDVTLVQGGCLLHDIGRSRTQGLDHAVVGARMLQEKGYPDALTRCVERHTGGGIDSAEAQKLGLPVKDYNPVTIEEKLVCHVDNLFDGSRRQPVTEELAYLAGRGLHHVAVKVQKLHSEISSLLGMDLDKFEG